MIATSLEDVCLVTVNYRGIIGIGRLLESLTRLEARQRLRVVIVHNGATARSREDLERIVATYPGRVEVVYSAENLWYWRAAARVIGRELGNPALGAAWFVVCNDDVVFPDPGFVRTLLTLDAETHAVVAPDIVSETTGERQNPFQRSEMGRWELLKWRLYFAHYFFARALLAADALTRPLRRWRWRRTAGPPQVPALQGCEERIHAPHGACIVFARSFFERGGVMDTGFTAYGEEMSVAAIAKRLGLPIVFSPQLKVVHGEHSSTGIRLTREKYRFQKQAFGHCLNSYGDLLTDGARRRA